MTKNSSPYFFRNAYLQKKLWIDIGGKYLSTLMTIQHDFIKYGSLNFLQLPIKNEFSNYQIRKHQQLQLSIENDCCNYQVKKYQ